MSKNTIRLGETCVNKQNLKMTIIRYNNSCDIDVEFEDGYVAYHKQYASFKKGSIKNHHYNPFIGKLYNLNCGATAKVIQYRTYGDVDVQILETNEIIYNSSLCHITKGKLRPYYYPTLCGVGYIGEAGKSNVVHKLKSYSVWVNMIRRCYSEEYKEKHVTYKNVTCCDEWLNYTNFKKWYDANYYEIKGEKCT